MNVISETPAASVIDGVVKRKRSDWPADTGASKALKPDHHDGINGKACSFTAGSEASSKTQADMQNLPAAHAKQHSKLRCRYGNYASYYGYRNRYLPDSRLECMSAAWFEQKEVLDIGCNSGVVTYQIAQKFAPKAVTGIDIDKKLIEAAKFNVRYYVDKQSSGFCPYPTSCILDAGPCPLPPPKIQANVSTAAENSSAFPLNISFVAGNYIFESEQSFVEYCSKQKPPAAEIDSEDANTGSNFDVILALSVTKWIHVNWGDAGVQRLFRRVFHDMKPGGIFILEPQEWKSYEKSKKDRKLEQDQLSVLREIKFKPDMFADYLCSTVGFELLKPPDGQNELPATSQHTAKGFQRPMHFFRKPATNTLEEK